MGKRLFTITFFLVATIAFSVGLAFDGTYRVTCVIEGDLLEVTDNGSKMTVRLAAIDAPEISPVRERPGQPFCEQARLHLTHLVFGKDVSIEEYGRDRYGRTLGVVYLSEVNINLEMVQAGLAEVYRGKSPERLDLTPYRESESKARKALLGIWVLRDQYFSPKDWREVYGENPVKK